MLSLSFISVITSVFFIRLCLSDMRCVLAANPCDAPSPCDDVNGYCNIAGDAQECSCKRGYRLNPLDHSVCEEIDECSLRTDGCAHNCTNTVGGYACSCQIGYTLSYNAMDCKGRCQLIINQINFASFQFFSFQFIFS